MSELSTITYVAPDIDALIAEKIMGVTVVKIVRGVAQHRVYRGYIPVDRYSQDWLATKQLQAKLVAGGVSVQIDQYEPTYFRVFIRDGITIVGEASANTEQLALCLAALKTIPE